MKSMLMAIMAVAVAVTFSAPAFAGEEGKKKPVDGGKYTDTFGDDKKAEEAKKPGGKYTDTFGDDKKAEEAKKPVPGK